MRQLALIALIIGAVVSDRIPLHKKTIKLQNFLREKALR
jgi:hypothetical protein